jgi:hypothetical protein
MNAVHSESSGLLEKELMKRTFLACIAMLIATAAFAADAPAKAAPALDPKVTQMVRDSIPYCADGKITTAAMEHKLPINLTGTVIKVDGPRTCAGQYVSVVSQQGGFYLGAPWFLDQEEGTLEQKLKSFTWRGFQQNFIPQVDRTPTRDGLYKVTLLQTTERGKLPIEGEIDPAGTIFFFGHFRPMNEDVRTSRMKAFEPFIAHAPTTGSSKPAVTVVEFSDFECPSCQRASGYMTPILDKYGDKVRYVRYDLPLVTNHPWAFAAALGGRAVYRQKPELFWKYKKHIYDNQEKLTAFTIDDFARGFAQDHELDLKKYDADIASPEIQAELMSGVGVAFSNDIRSTPTYIVNGTIVDAGEGGKALTSYIEELVKK